MREDVTFGSEETPAMSGAQSWMLYGAAGTPAP